MSRLQDQVFGILPRSVSRLAKALARWMLVADRTAVACADSKHIQFSDLHLNTIEESRSLSGSLFDVPVFLGEGSTLRRISYLTPYRAAPTGRSGGLWA